MEIGKTLFVYLTPWRPLHYLLEPDRSTARKVTCVALTIFGALLFPLNLAANLIYDRIIVPLTQEDIRPLDLSTHKTLGEVGPLEKHSEAYFWMLTDVGPYKPYGEHTDAATYRFMPRREYGYPSAEERRKFGKEYEDKRDQCREACLKRGKQRCLEAIYDPEAMYALWQCNKDRIIAYMQAWEKSVKVAADTDPASETIRGVDLVVLQACRRIFERVPLNKKEMEECGDSFAKFIGTGLNRAICLRSDPRIHTFFMALGEAAYGDIREEHAAEINLPEKGVKQVLELHRAFPRHSYRTIRSVLRYFEHSPRQMQKVRAVLERLPISERHYFIYQNKVYTTD